MDLNIADVFIIVILLISTVVGLYRGFIREFLTIVTWIIASFVAYIYGNTVGEYFTFVESANTKELLGMITVFIGVVFLGFLLKLIIFKATKISGVSPVDRITGAFFGALRGCIIIVLVLLASTTNITTQDWYKKSQLLPRFAKAADYISSATPKSWKDDAKKEVDDFMKLEQAPAPVTAATPTTNAPTVAPATTSTPPAASPTVNPPTDTKAN